MSTVPNAHRRFTDWTKIGLWRRLHHDRTEPGRPWQVRLEDLRRWVRDQGIAVRIARKERTIA